jgi:hypothetical protein
MRNILVLLFVILIFFVCATIGFNLASQQQLSNPLLQILPISRGQHNFIIVLVDQYQQPSSRLVSVWFVSLYSVESNPPELAFSQIYAPQSTSELSKALGTQFSITSHGDPGNNFWNVIRSHKIDWENYVVVDLPAAERILEWLLGQSYNAETIITAFGKEEDTKVLVGLICQSLPGTVDKPLPFQWRELIPGHFRTSMRLEDGLVYWDMATHFGSPSRCELLPAP